MFESLRHVSDQQQLTSQPISYIYGYGYIYIQIHTFEMCLIILRLHKGSKYTE